MSYYIAQNQTGPLPQKYPFDLPITGDVTIAFSGTCWSNSPGFAGVNVYLDGNLLGDVPLFFNNVSQHLELPASFPGRPRPRPAHDHARGADEQYDRRYQRYFLIVDHRLNSPGAAGRSCRGAN